VLSMSQLFFITGVYSWSHEDVDMFLCKLLWIFNVRAEIFQFWKFSSHSSSILLLPHLCFSPGCCLTCTRNPLRHLLTTLALYLWVSVLCSAWSLCSPVASLCLVCSNFTHGVYFLMAVLLISKISSWFPFHTYLLLFNLRWLLLDAF
jgi:hypothetical protein